MEWLVTAPLWKISDCLSKRKVDIFLGAKPVGRTAHPGQSIDEGVEDTTMPLLTDS